MKSIIITLLLTTCIVASLVSSQKLPYKPKPLLQTATGKGQMLVRDATYGVVVYDVIYAIDAENQRTSNTISNGRTLNGTLIPQASYYHVANDYKNKYFVTMYQSDPSGGVYCMKSTNVAGLGDNIFEQDPYQNAGWNGYKIVNGTLLGQITGAKLQIDTDDTIIMNVSLNAFTQAIKFIEYGSLKFDFTSYKVGYVEPGCFDVPPGMDCDSNIPDHKKIGYKFF
jgi:hypothetical protein